MVRSTWGVPHASDDDVMGPGVDGPPGVHQTDSDQLGESPEEQLVEMLEHGDLEHYRAVVPDLD